MPKEYSKEDLWKLYEQLPEDLKKTIFSEETAAHIYDICQKNEIGDERISEVAKYVGKVLLGILPFEDFQEILEEELKIERKRAKEIGRDIFRFIFFPVKNSLEQLYREEIKPPVKSVVDEVMSEPFTIEPESKEKKDVYREPIK